MDSIFLKSLADVVKLSRTVTNLDQLTFHSQLATDIKTELNSKNDQAKQQALLKLFYLFMQASSIKWAEFNVINLMASQDYNTKRISFLIAHQVIDHQSQGLIMLTNLFKKVPPSHSPFRNSPNPRTPSSAPTRSAAWASSATRTSPKPSSPRWSTSPATPNQSSARRHSLSSPGSSPCRPPPSPTTSRRSSPNSPTTSRTPPSSRQAWPSSARSSRSPLPSTPSSSSSSTTNSSSRKATGSSSSSSES